MILAELEAQGGGTPAGAIRFSEPAGDQFSMEDLGALALRDKLREVDVDTLTPIEAMNLIYQWKKEL